MRFIRTPIVDGKKRAPRTYQGRWPDLISKWEELVAQASPDLAVGGYSSEVLTTGGNARIAWVDLDTEDQDGVNAWIEGFMRTVKAVRSSSGRFHLFIRLHPELGSLPGDVHEWLRATMPTELLQHVDRIAVAGCRPDRRIYLPLVDGKGILPQWLVKDLTPLSNL